jgi:hypothetical protein
VFPKNIASKAYERLATLNSQGTFTSVSMREDCNCVGPVHVKANTLPITVVWNYYSLTSSVLARFPHSDPNFLQHGPFLISPLLLLSNEPMYTAVTRMDYCSYGLYSWREVKSVHQGPSSLCCSSLCQNGKGFGVRNLSLAVAEPRYCVLVQDSISTGGSRCGFENESD